MKTWKNINLSTIKILKKKTPTLQIIERKKHKNANIKLLREKMKHITKLLQNEITGHPSTHC
jgi:hypothetical protein